MKKFLLYTAAFVAMAACNKAAFDEVAPEIGGHKVSVNISAEENTDTRVSYDEDWGITWSEGDALLAVDNAGFTSKLTMDAYDDTNPTFSGDALNNKYNLLYPYLVIDGLVSKDMPYFKLDLTAQSAGAEHTYLISEKKIESSKTKPFVKMMHIGATMELDIKFTGYDDYTIESLEVNGLNSTGELDANFEYGSEDLIIKPRPNTITITDVATKIDNTKDGIAKVRFNILPTVIAAEGSVRVNAYLKGADGDIVALTKTITNNSTEEVEFGRAKYHTLKCGFSSTDVITYSDKWTDHVEYYSNAVVGGSTEDNPFEISTPEQLAYLAYDININTENTYEGKYFKLTADIDLTGHEWEAIGIYLEDIYGNPTKENKFMGTLDGDGHKITGLYINQPTADFQGLFSYAVDATIKNLSVSGSVSGKDYVGGVVGIADENSTITNCYNSGSVKSSAFAYVGGVAGLTYSSTITNCYNSGTVEGGATVYVGGIVGTVEGDSNTITHCYWDESKCTVGFNGTATQVDIEGMTTDEMQSEAFNSTLNNNKKDYNNTSPAVLACDWRWESGKYPYIVFED